MEVKASPVENKVALSNHRNELLVVDLDQGATITVDQGAFRNIGGFDWSPDGRWLAYSFSPRMNTSEIRLFRVAEPDEDDTGSAREVQDGVDGADTGAPLDEVEHTATPPAEEADAASRRFTITKPVLHDVRPAFDPDGRYLYFLSYREFNPVYDGLHFNLGFPWGMRPYLVTLQADLPNPFIPRPDFDDEEGEPDDEHEGDGSDEGDAGMDEDLDLGDDLDEEMEDEGDGDG